MDGPVNSSDTEGEAVEEGAHVFVVDESSVVPDNVVGEWVSTGVGKRDDPEGDTVEMARLG